jgi:hypothetical protein
MYTASVQAKAKAPPPPPPPPPPPKTVYGQRAVRVHVPPTSSSTSPVEKRSERKPPPPRHRALDEAFAAAQEVTQAGISGHQRPSAVIRGQQEVTQAGKIIEVALETLSMATGETRLVSTEATRSHLAHRDCISHSPVATEAAAVAAQSGAVAWPTAAEIVETIIDAAVRRAVKRAEAACMEDPSAANAQGPQEGATGEGEWPTQEAAEQREWPTQEAAEQREWPTLEAEFVPPPARVCAMPTARFGSALCTGHAEELHAFEPDAWADDELLHEDDFEEVCEEVCEEVANRMQPSEPVVASSTSPSSTMAHASAAVGDAAMDGLDAVCGTEEDSIGIGAGTGGGTRDTADDPVSREVARRMDLIRAALKPQEEAW